MIDADLKQKLLQIQALAERGVGGEKVNAARMLKDLLDKKGLTIEDLNDEPERQIYWFKYNTVYEKNLVHQIVTSVWQAKSIRFYLRKGKAMHGFKLTAEEYESVNRQHDIYRKELKGEMDMLFSAFIQKHKLVAPAEVT